MNNESVEAVALEPCPWCGGTDIVLAAELDCFWQAMKCSAEGCGVEGPATSQNKAEAARAWNTRATPREPSSNLDAVAVTASALKHAALAAFDSAADCDVGLTEIRDALAEINWSEIVRVEPPGPYDGCADGNIANALRAHLPEVIMAQCEPHVAKDAVCIVKRAADLLDAAASSNAHTDLIAPWADFHGDLPDYDHPLRCVFESGVEYAVQLLAKTLGVGDYSICDGTEEFDGDLGGTLNNIVLAAMPKDEHDDEIWPNELPAVVTRDALQALHVTERDLPSTEPEIAEAITGLVAIHKRLLEEIAAFQQSQFPVTVWSEAQSWKDCTALIAGIVELERYAALHVTASEREVENALFQIADGQSDSFAGDPGKWPTMIARKAFIGSYDKVLWEEFKLARTALTEDKA